MAKQADLPSLSNTEWEVMKVLWDKGELAARDVYAEVKEETDWAYTTVKTLLSRLVAKGALDYQQVGNSYLYRPAKTREQMTRTEMKGFLQRVLDGSFSPFLANFIEETDLSEDEISDLRKILERIEKRTKKRR
jgi:BlaI family penicillinase repressor